MDTVSIVALAASIVVGASVGLLFAIYFVNNTVMKNLAASQRNHDLASTLIILTQQLQNKHDAEQNHKSA